MCIFIRREIIYQKHFFKVQENLEKYILSMEETSIPILKISYPPNLIIHEAVAAETRRSSWVWENAVFFSVNYILTPVGSFCKWNSIPITCIAVGYRSVNEEITDGLNNEKTNRERWDIISLSVSIFSKKICFVPVCIFIQLLWGCCRHPLAHSERRPQIFIPKRKSTSNVSSNWQHKFLYFHYKSVKLDVLCRQNIIWRFGNPFQSKKLPICT